MGGQSRPWLGFYFSGINRPERGARGRLVPVVPSSSFSTGTKESMYVYAETLVMRLVPVVPVVPVILQTFL